MPISDDFHYTKRRAEVLESEMAYVEVGTGNPIVFLHGNPTSSYLWRNIIPYLEGLGRCIAPDLIGMGDSSKLPESGPDRYRFVEHRTYLDALLETLEITGNVVLVVHDWGSALGFDWVRRHPEAVKGIAYMESIVKQYTLSEFATQLAGEVDEGDTEELVSIVETVFKDFRSPEGEKMVLQDNMFVEQLLPQMILRELTPKEMDTYRQPFINPGEDRRPTLTWPGQIPLNGDPADVVEIVEAYGKWMSENSIPKLFIRAEPGAAIRGSALDFCRTWPNQTEVTVPGIHFVQEDSPDEIGEAIMNWYRDLEF